MVKAWCIGCGAKGLRLWEDAISELAMANILKRTTKP